MLDQFSAQDLVVPRLGETTVPSPLKRELFVDDDEGVSLTSMRSQLERETVERRYFEIAGPREHIYFQPERTTCAIVTCGGLCPGLNDVIRGLTLQLKEAYGVPKILGLRYGYQGLVERYGHAPLMLTNDSVSEIHRRGGTILKSSRGDQSPVEMVDYLAKNEIDVLFVIGGDGTMAGADVIGKEINRRDLRIGVVGIPKTIDNDVAIIQKTFGFETAVAEAVRVVDGGHIEAHDYPNGVAIIRLMGRNAGFIAAAATIASGDVNFCLVPEVPFSLEGENGLFNHLEARLKNRGHAVIVVAEGAGKDLCAEHGCDDIGVLLKAQIKAEFARRDLNITLKYIDPSYIIRSVPATADDSVFCAELAYHASHAAMTGRTGVLVGYFRDEFVHIPLTLVTGRSKQLDLKGRLWTGVLQSTGQPSQLG